MHTHHHRGSDDRRLADAKDYACFGGGCGGRTADERSLLKPVIAARNLASLTQLEELKVRTFRYEDMKLAASRAVVVHKAVMCGNVVVASQQPQQRFDRSVPAVLNHTRAVH